MNHAVIWKAGYVLAIVCPGQGSQTPGFLAPWLELPSVAGHLASLSEIAGIDLTAHGTTSDEDTIKDTAVAQPLIVAAGLVAAKSLFDVELSSLPVILAGHSVGEITASALAGVLTEKEAMTFVREPRQQHGRGRRCHADRHERRGGRRPRRGPRRHRSRRRRRRQTSTARARSSPPAPSSSSRPWRRIPRPRHASSR